MSGCIGWCVKLSLTVPTFYRVKRGQNLTAIAEVFHLPPRLLACHNRLEREVEEGQVLFIPEREGNLYRVQGGESKTLLCGSPESFEKKNGTACFYIGQVIVL